MQAPLPSVASKGSAETTRLHSRTARERPARPGPPRVQAPLPWFNEQELCNVAWALGTLGRCEAALLDGIAADALRRGLGAFVPQGVSNLVWAFASLGHLHERFLKARGPAVRAPPRVRAAARTESTGEPGPSSTRCDELGPVLLARRRGPPARRAARPRAQAVSRYLPDHIGDCTTQSVSNIIWGCAVLNFYDQNLFEVVARELRGAPAPARPSAPARACGLRPRPRARRLHTAPF